MKIAHIIFSLRTGGTETMLVDIINQQVDKAEICLFIINNEINENILTHINTKVKIIRLNRVPTSKDPLPIIKLNLSLIAYRPTVIHCHNHKGVTCLLPYFWKKTVLTVHTTGIPTSNLKKYKLLFAISQAVATDIYSRSNQASLIVYNGIDPKRIKFKTYVSVKLPFRILQVSRLDHETKGQHIALQAIKILKENGFNNITLDFIGDGNSFDYLKYLVNEYSLSEYVNFLGLKDREYIYSNLKDYSLLIQPSLYEGFGLTIAEAMAARLPVLVSDIEGPMEIIEYGKFGFFFKNGDANSLAVEIKNILNINEPDLFKIVLKGYKHVSNNFNVKNTAQNYINNYN